MDKEALVWNKILATVLKMPTVKVDRVAFLRKELRPYCNQSRLQMLGSVRPYTVVSEKVVDRLARQCINKHTALATATSTVVGLPGGLTMAAALPADVVQYFFHVFVLSQKLAYLYGYPDFCEEDGELNDMASNLLTIFMGVMMGAPVAEKGISELSVAMAESAVTRLPRVALTKTAIFTVASQIARMIGTRLTKNGFAKGVGRFIPIAGGLFSGGLTLLTFRRGANRLCRQLSAQRHLFDDGAIDAIELANIKTSFVKAGQAERDPEKVQLAMIQALINIAKINDVVSPEKYHAIEQRIARAKIDSKEKLDLLANIDSDRSYDVDFDLIAADRDVAQETFDGMKQLTQMDEKVSMAEKIYLNMVAQKLGIEKTEPST
ncbi:MAG: hypothetical protein IKQ58_08990 [Prevotella sp.]|nr:hypothetical protein [Prevotella sp.]MBR6826939.1 hypothetical protein [Prevotella sp.]